MNSEFDVFAREFGAPALMEHFGDEKSVRIVEEGKVDGFFVNAIVGIIHIETIDEMDGTRIQERRTVHILSSELDGEITMTSEFYIGTDPDPWSVQNVDNARGPLVACELTRRYIADRAKVRRGE